MNSQYKKCDDEQKLVNDYFVEIFSWSVLPKDLLFTITIIPITTYEQKIENNLYGFIK